MKFKVGDLLHKPKHFRTSLNPGIMYVLITKTYRDYEYLLSAFFEKGKPYKTWLSELELLEFQLLPYSTFEDDHEI